MITLHLYELAILAVLLIITWELVTSGGLILKRTGSPTAFLCLGLGLGLLLAIAATLLFHTGHPTGKLVCAILAVLIPTVFLLIIIINHCHTKRINRRYHD